MNAGPKVLLSNFVFFTDITRRGSLEIPLGLMLEVVWPAKGRWLGLVGRTEITKGEMKLVHAPSLPELTKPWSFVYCGFEDAWRSPAGTSGEFLAKKYSHALHVTSPAIKHNFFPSSFDERTDWAEIVGFLAKQLSDLGKSVESKLDDNVVQIGKYRKTSSRAEEILEAA